MPSLSVHRIAPKGTIQRVSGRIFSRYSRLHRMHHQKLRAKQVSVRASTSKDTDMPGYGEGSEYWDTKHMEDQRPYEWMQGYEDLNEVIAKYSSKWHRLLHVGCGSSLLAEEMYDNGYHNIVNMDISSVVINKMRDRNKDERPKMKWMVMDATAMEFVAGQFDIVIDKCTVDTLVCCKDSDVVVGKYLQEVVRVLKQDGVFLAFTLGDPSVRLSYFTKPHLDFRVDVIKLPVPYTKSQFHYAYACHKKPPAPESRRSRKS